MRMRSTMRTPRVLLPAVVALWMGVLFFSLPETADGELLSRKWPADEPPGTAAELVTDTLMDTPEARRRVAVQTLEFADSLGAR